MVYHLLCKCILPDSEKRGAAQDRNTGDKKQMTRLQKLAISEEGFLFDPTTGESFTVNPTGLLILKGLKDDLTPDAIIETLVATYDVTADEARRDVDDFCDHLKSCKLF